ncbi:MAG: hypothetical protein HYY17_05190 [Planctomycetes bacterium]|nr:hypothetical protein [Planctomycetota bacterium]
MRVVKIEEAKPGMRVAKDVLDLRGNLLYKAGTEISLQILETLRGRNVTHLFLEDSPGLGSAGVDPEKRAAEVDAELDRVFADVASHPVMGALKEAAKRVLKSKVK